MITLSVSGVLFLNIAAFLKVLRNIPTTLGRTSVTMEIYTTPSPEAGGAEGDYVWTDIGLRGAALSRGQRLHGNRHMNSFVCGLPAAWAWPGGKSASADTHLREYSGCVLFVFFFCSSLPLSIHSAPFSYAILSQPAGIKCGVKRAESMCTGFITGQS